MDISDIVAIDEKIGGRYRPEVWERQIGYYLRRDPEASVVAEVDGKVAGFMLGEVRSGEFGLEEPTGWIEVLGVDPGHRGKAIGRRMAEAILEHFRQRRAPTASAPWWTRRRGGHPQLLQLPGLRAVEPAAVRRRVCKESVGTWERRPG